MHQAQQPKKDVKSNLYYYHLQHLRYLQFALWQQGQEEQQTCLR
jgi:hypothetical protein